VDSLRRETSPHVRADAGGELPLSPLPRRADVVQTPDPAAIPHLPSAALSTPCGGMFCYHFATISSGLSGSQPISSSSSFLV
jgi:hypothetical protein